MPFPSPGYLPDSGIKPGSPALQADALTSEPPGEHQKKATIPRISVINKWMTHTVLLSQLDFLTYSKRKINKK